MSAPRLHNPGRLSLRVLAPVVGAGLILTTIGLSPVAAQPLPGTTCAMFPRDSVFNTDISSVPVNNQSAAWMANMAQNSNLHPDFGTFAQQYGIPINIAPPPASGLTPTFAYDPESDHPAEGYPVSPSTNIEGGPSAPSGSDRHALVMDQNRCKLYELYNLQNFSGGQTPSAGSGAAWDLASDAMRPAGWTSADAAGLPMAPLLLRPDEILAGSVTHAIRFTTHCTNNYIWPASHQAGLCSTGFPPMGSRFRLKKTFAISTFGANTQVVLKAFQHYGLILADNGSDWYFQGTTDDWWGTTAGGAVVADLKTIPASQFEAVDESALQAATGSYRALQSGANALPQDRLHFGVASGPGDTWMAASGVPWRYRYTYLAGGVNTGSGWETWNSPSGAYATNYMNASSAAGYIPVFPYYELLQSSPSTGSTESDRDFSNLNNAATMAAYYANFKLLMQKAGAFGNTVIVHVEPDLWGYLEQRAAGGTASALGASVASSGFVEAAGLPNTAAGFAYELLKLRDSYAPNAVLAIHASAWGSGIDIAGDTSASVNAVTEADKTAAFLNSAGIASNPYGSTWDLVFNDVDDHDAGWWEQQGANNQYFTHWWDPSNVKFPNFNRYLSWVSELHARTARPQVVWQVPVGNQYFLTMNNTCGHYQDNIGPYFISHASVLSAAGLIAVLFGAGNSCQTNNTDLRGDGVTNNGGVPTTDLAGNCNACNTHASSYADDDGGYLRTFVGRYYASWTSLGGTLTSGPAATSWASNRLDVFARGSNNSLLHSFWTGSQWSPWEDLGGVLTSDPAAVAWGPNRIDVFGRGTDNQLWHKFWAGAWSSWEPLGGGLSSGPAVSSWGSGRLDVFVRGTDNQLWHKLWAGGWSSWEPLGGVLTADPAAVSWGSNRIDVFVRGTDNAVWHKWYSSGWTGWQSLGGSPAYGPAAASCSRGHLDVYATGTSGGLLQAGFNGAAWGPWSSSTGTWTSKPGAVCLAGTNTVFMFERGSDNALWQGTAAAS